MLDIIYLGEKENRREQSKVSNHIMKLVTVIL